MAKSQGRQKPPLLFQVSDYWGNLVALSEATWNTHIIDPAMGHPQMRGCENLVQQLLQDPLEIREGAYPRGAVFISDPGFGPGPEGMRAVVLYTNVAFEKGAYTGIVTTAYPIDIARYPTPRIGRVIVQRRR
jgi:hypothetical protein